MKNRWMSAIVLTLSVAGTASAESPAPAPAVVSSGAAGDSAPPTLFSAVHYVGGYGGMSVSYSRIAGSDGALVGGEGAVLLDHRLALGGAGYGWARETRGPADVDGVPRDLELGYGGLLVRYSILTGGLVYASIGTVVGAGAVSLNRDTDDDVEDERSDAADSFFVVEPQVSLQVNLVRWMRLGLQAGYRITNGLGRLGYTEQDINGVTLGGTLQFGSL